jgi:hypothetical protein
VAIPLPRTSSTKPARHVDLVRSEQDFEPNAELIADVLVELVEVEPLELVIE